MSRIALGLNNKSHVNSCNARCWDEYQTYSPERIFYGARWQRQRAEALNRDGDTCQRCGVEGKAIRVGLHVHHIIPFKLWPDQDSANQLANLIALCPSCHKLADLAFHRDGTILVGSASPNIEVAVLLSRSSLIPSLSQQKQILLTERLFPGSLIPRKDLRPCPAEA